jgi:hypothetical protein
MNMTTKTLIGAALLTLSVLAVSGSASAVALNRAFETEAFAVYHYSNNCAGRVAVGCTCTADTYYCSAGDYCTVYYGDGSKYCEVGPL